MLGRSSRDEYKQRKALEEARKAGTALPEVDETGKDINPHIPEYIAKAPWYLSKGTPTLSHQKSSLVRHDQEEHLENGGTKKRKLLTAVVTKYRKGACENCGSMTHKTKECVERPRRRGAKVTGVDLVADEIVEEIDAKSFDSKRDRWRGYDPEEYLETFYHYKKLENERRKKRALELAMKQQEKLKKQEEKSLKADKGNEDSDSDSDTADEDIEDKSGATYSKTDPKTKSTIRDLRIREDVAKYLRNLDPNSAYYDPKTRSMRDNPLPQMDPNELVYAGDNQLKKTGEWKNFVQLQKYAWDAQERGQDINFVGAPSQAELGYKEFIKKQQELAEKRKKAFIENYGGEEYLKRPEEDALTLEEKEIYVQFSKDGKIVGGNKKIIPQSRYPEDMYEFGHTSVWGSYWKDGKWGYACCKIMNRTTPCPNSDII
jgi:pre-mRNA-processing factor SLU7